MSILLDALHLLDDPEIKPYVRNQRVDLAASNVPIVSTNRYVVFSFDVPPGQCLVVKGMAFFACERTYVGLANASFRYLTAQEGNGFFSFQPMVDRNSPYQVNLDFNSPKIAAGTLNNSDRQGSNGFTEITDSPVQDVKLYENPLHTVAVPAGKTFEVAFSVLSVSTLNSSGIPVGGQFQVGTGIKRVDFAGALVTGLIMPQQLYDQVKDQVQREAAYQKDATSGRRGGKQGQGQVKGQDDDGQAAPMQGGSRCRPSRTG